MDRRPGPGLRGAASVSAAAAVFLAILAGCATTASPSPAPTDRPTIAPVATPTLIPPGPLTDVGPLAAGTYVTSDAFIPAFEFELRGDRWRSVVTPDEYGFVLATPNVASPDALIGVTKPISADLKAFLAELRTNGFLDDQAVQAELTVGGLPATSISATRDTSVEAFQAARPNGESMTAFGGTLDENRLIYVAHPVRPIVLIFSAKGDSAVQTRFVFDTLVQSITFK